MANTDRKCNEPGCKKYLSDYNPHPNKCFAHQPGRMYYLADVKMRDEFIRDLKPRKGIPRDDHNDFGGAYVKDDV